jgi:hypothetical protein
MLKGKQRKKRNDSRIQLNPFSEKRMAKFTGKKLQHFKKRIKKSKLMRITLLKRNLQPSPRAIQKEKGIKGTKITC